MTFHLNLLFFRAHLPFRTPCHRLLWCHEVFLSDFGVAAPLRRSAQGIRFGSPKRWFDDVDEPEKHWKKQCRCLGYVVRLMAEILHHLGCIWSTKWCRISSINSITQKLQGHTEEFRLVPFNWCSVVRLSPSFLWWTSKWNHQCNLEYSIGFEGKVHFGVCPPEFPNIFILDKEHPFPNLMKSENISVDGRNPAPPGMVLKPRT